MQLDYKTYEEAAKHFNWNERWEVFDKPREKLNIYHECVERHAPDKTAVRLKNSDGRTDTCTFAELSRWSSQFANLLKKHGVNEGDRVGVVLNPSLEYYASFYGTLKRGGVVVPCYALLGPEGLEYRLQDSRTKVVIIGRDRADLAARVVEKVIVAEEFFAEIGGEETHFETAPTSADTMAVIQYSSGTTGLPKAVLYNHGAVSVTAVYVKFWLGLRDGDRSMCTSSPAWGHGIWYGTVGPLIFGNGIGAYSGKFIPEVLLQALEEFEITVVTAIPRVYTMVMNCGRLDDYRLKLRRLTYTGSAMDRKTQEYFYDKLGTVPASNYGNTEVGPIVIDFDFPDYKAKIGSAGKPMFGTKVGVIDAAGNSLPAGQVGELAVWRKENWNPVGDTGYLDEEGYVWSFGRSDDVIKSSGYRIGPFEIECVLEKHPAVAEAAVIGSPDEERGEIVKAFIVTSRHPSDELKLELQEYVKNRLSFHEYPRQIEFVKELPRTPDGKLKRKALKLREIETKPHT